MHHSALDGGTPGGTAPVREKIHRVGGRFWFHTPAFHFASGGPGGVLGLILILLIVFALFDRRIARQPVRI
jgi:hypothetical protein